MTTLMTRRLGGALLALGLTLPVSALAENFTVNSSADDGDGVCDATCTLRDAIQEANENEESDTITFDLDENDRVILLSGTQLTIGNDTADPDLTIDGDGSPGIRVNADDRSRVFFIASGANAALQGLVITGGNSRGGSNNGGGIFNDGGTLRVANSTVSGNSALEGGGGIANLGTVAIANNTISGNRAPVGGGPSAAAASRTLSARSPSPAAPSAATTVSSAAVS